MRSIPISQVDAVFTSGRYPIEFLTFYRIPVSTPKIRSALRHLAPVFWPIFGEYNSGMITFERYCEQVCFTEKVVDRDFDLTASNEEIYKQYSRINPAGSTKLFFMTVIQYRNGTVLIPKMSHLAGDGYSYFYFLTTLAAICRDMHRPFKKLLIRNLHKPHHRRTIPKQFRCAHPKPESVQQQERFTIKSKKVLRSDVRDIIAQIAADYNQKVSTNDILAAMIVKRMLEIKKERFGRDLQLTIPIDVRRQIRAYGPKYFGNGLLFHTISFNRGNIEKSGIDRLAVEIRKSMPVITKESYVDYLQTLETIITRGEMSKLRPYDPDKGCLVTNLSKLPTHQLNFGSGVPDFIFPLTIEKNSAAVLSKGEHYILRLSY